MTTVQQKRKRAVVAIAALVSSFLIDQRAACERSIALSVGRLQSAAGSNDFDHLRQMEHGALREHPIREALVLQQSRAPSCVFHLLAKSFALASGQRLRKLLQIIALNALRMSG